MADLPTSVEDTSHIEEKTVHQKRLPTKEECKLLVRAAIKGDMEVVTRLSNDGVDMDAIIHEEYQQTPLHGTASYGHDNIVKKLISLHVNIECVDVDNATPLHMACDKGHALVVTTLLHNNANIECRTNKNFTPLHYACQGGYEPIVKTLLLYNADIECRIDDNFTPLHMACSKGHALVATTLLHNNANIECRTSDNQTPVYIAARKGQNEVVKLLLQSKADVNCICTGQHTPLHVAALCGHLMVVKTLLAYNAKLDCVDVNNKTPLQLAVEEGKSDVVKYLVEHGKMDITQFDQNYKEKIEKLLKESFDKKLLEEPPKDNHSASPATQKVNQSMQTMKNVAVTASSPSLPENGSHGSLLNDVPKMKHLNKLVIDKIAPYWKKVADSLEFDIPVIRSIEKRCLKDDAECCDGVLRDWISSDHGLQPKTWKTFISALQDIKQFASLATVIEKQLQGIDDTPSGLTSGVRREQSEGVNQLLETSTNLPSSATLPATGHHNEIANQVPKMKHINKFVIDKIAPDWIKVADSLEFDIQTIREIEQSCMKDALNCCDNLIRNWLSTDQGLKPKTWQTLINALKDIKNLTAVTQEIENDIQVLS